MCFPKSLVCCVDFFQLTHRKKEQVTIMSDADLILKMIEAVDPSNTAKLNEIDVRVAYYLSGREFPTKDIKHTVYVEKKHGDGSDYTRSRDALKKIRPEGWGFRNTLYSHQLAICDYAKPNELFNKGEQNSGVLPTEELAELHAITQAIQYERN
jgi:hypothetical protein